MYIDRHPTTNKSGKKSRRILLRESYRENGKVKKRTIANLSALSDEEIDAIEFALKNKDKIAKLQENVPHTYKTDKYFGSFDIVQKALNKLKISEVLGQGKEANIIKWMIFTRLRHQASVFKSFKLQEFYRTSDYFQLSEYKLNDFYRAYQWLYNKQQEIEDKLFKKEKKQLKNLFLYDVSSSYFEGEKNALSAWGYNRDKKQGKKQLVYGLLTDEQGDPISVEGFKGNTSDVKTFKSQLDKLSRRFKCERIVIVGDKGLIKQSGIETVEKYGFYYLTTITKEQIRKKVKEGLFQLQLFEDELVEVYDTNEAVRYILRRNPVRASQIRKNRREIFEKIKSKVEASNSYLNEHPRAKVERQLKKINSLIAKYKFSKWLSCEVSEARRLQLKLNISALKQKMYYDGSYALKTNLTEKELSKEVLHERYKALSEVEQAFRVEKTSFLELRPIYFRREDTTRAHLFVVMLAYKVYRYLYENWKSLGVDVRTGLLALDRIQTIKIQTKKNEIIALLEPDEKTQKLIKSLNFTKPKLKNTK